MIKQWLNKQVSVAKDTLEKNWQELQQSGNKLFESAINGLPISLSIERQEVKSIEFDEKHYFVVPYKISEHGFALHSLRNLPKGAPEVNELPKRRVFHFADEYGEGMLRTFMKEQAEENISAQNRTNSLHELANDIDALDKKLTYGMLLVGGLAALVNPLVGAGIALKAVLPGASGLISKYGLRPVADKLSQNQLKSAIEDAKLKVDQDFQAGNTLSVINPILVHLKHMLETNESEYDPLIDIDFSSGSITELENEQWRYLTETAICHTYKEVYNNQRLHDAAHLGPEDIRWLKVLYASRQD